MKKHAWMVIAFSAAAFSFALAVRLRASVGAPVAGAGAVRESSMIEGTASESLGNGGAVSERSSNEGSAHADSVRELLWAVPFRVEKPFTHEWRKEKPLVSAGYLLVLGVDPEYVRPRETAEPVLYAGDQTVERVNHGFESGRVVAILPAARKADGAVALELSATPFWFGSPELPERITADEIRVQRARAEKNGARRFTSEEIAAALRRGGDPLVLSRREDLEARAGLLVLEHSPDERDLADGLLVPSGK